MYYDWVGCGNKQIWINLLYVFFDQFFNILCSSNRHNYSNDKVSAESNRHQDKPESSTHYFKITFKKGLFKILV